MSVQWLIASAWFLISVSPCCLPTTTYHLFDHSNFSFIIFCVGAYRLIVPESPVELIK